MPHTILILNGPNLNLLGEREPEVYGRTTLADIASACDSRARTLGLTVDFRQSNHEGELVQWVQEARGTASGLIVNAAGYTTTSIALLDALKTFEGPIVELHLSNIFRREPFRQESYVSLAADGIICGFGASGYELALDAIARLVET